MPTFDNGNQKCIMAIYGMPDLVNSDFIIEYFLLFLVLFVIKKKKSALYLHIRIKVIE